MKKSAWIYVIGLLLAGAIFSAWAYLVTPVVTFPMPTFVFFLACATLAQFLKVPAPNHQTYDLDTIFLFASALLLEPFWFVGVVVVSLSISWGKERLAGSPRLRKWYLQPFNMSNRIIAGVIASRLALLLAAPGTPFLSSATVIAALAGALVYVLINHLAVGGALVLARGVSWRESGIMEIENILMDYVGLCMGYMLSVVWRIDASLMLLILAPLVLTYRALSIPSLKQQAQIDGKTGLLNAAFFNKSYIAEMDRARNMEHPLSVIMADLDLLRNINNTYGHLAGDAVLAGVAKIIRDHIRKYDLAGRFGGEEFCVALPGIPLGEAKEIAERMREAVASTGFKLHADSPAINATMSLGVACFPQDAAAPNELIHQADVAVYQAKLQGRNCVVCATEVPHSIKLEMPGVTDRLGQGQDPTTPPKPVLVPVERRKPASAPSSAEAKSVPMPSRVRPWLAILVGVVLMLALTTSVGGFLLQPAPDPLIVLLLMIMAGITQMPQLKNLYGEMSLSVSVAINFAAAVLVGLPGVVFTSLAIVVAHRVFRLNKKQGWQPLVYKTAYNWAIHVLAAVPVVLVAGLLPKQWDTVSLLISLGAMAIAALGYFAVETWLLVAAISAEKSVPLVATWQAECSWLAPQYVVLCLIGFFLTIAYNVQGNVGILVFTIPVLMMYYSQREYVSRAEKGVQELQRMNQELTGANARVLEASVAMREMNEELLVTFAKMIDARDPYVSGHSAQVATYAVAVAAELGLPEDEAARVRQAAFFHDIGKIGIPEEILHKPGCLSREEYGIIKKHAVIGAQFLETCQGLRYLVPAVRYHHERWDGQGYPGGISGERIPLDARILAICDAVEAMASDRPYHRAMPLDAIIAEVERCAGTQFDPRVAAAFIRFARRCGSEFIINSARTVAQRTDVILYPMPVGEALNVAVTG